MARPTDYSEEILTKAQEYIDSCEDEEEQQLSGLSAKGTELYKNKLRVKLPTIEGLSIALGVSRETVYAWEKEGNAVDETTGQRGEKSAFSDIIGILRAKQGEALINKGLSGDYNPTIAKVLLTKHGYREGVDHTTNDKDLPPPAGVVEKRVDAILKPHESATTQG